MRIHLFVSGGTMHGRGFTLDQERVLVGRDPSADVRFDAEGDRKVSGRHAELRRGGAGWLVRDLGSTNGTFRNGARVEGEEPLVDGDRLTLGADGPSLRVELLPGEHGPAAVSGHVAARGAPRRGARRWWSVAAVLLVITGAGLAGAALLRGHTGGHGGIAAVRRTVEGTGESDRGAAAGSAANRAAGAALPAAAQAGEMDYAAVVAAGARAVALVAVEMPGGTASSGTAFAIGERLLVTNRHVVQVTDGPRARRVLVKFSETDEWIPARIDRVDSGADLATLVLEAPARAPRSVHGLAARGTEPRVGDPVVLIGYPLGTDTPMDEGRDDFVAAPSVFRGMVSKRVRGLLQIDAFAGQGSSGSPVFDGRGAVVGVVYGGPRDGGGRIVYAVSPEAMLDFLGDSAAPLVP